MKVYEDESLKTLVSLGNKNSTNTTAEEKKENCKTSLYILANIVADKVLGNTINKGFPIDIEEIVRKEEIEIYRTDLNADKGEYMEKVSGFLRRRSNGKSVIYLDANDSRFTQRYVLAHEYSHYIFNKCLGSTHNNEEHFIDPFFAKEKSELIVDILTTFLLFPPSLVLAEFESYADKMKAKQAYPIDGFEWLHSLGQSAQVSLYYTIISYQHIKFYMCDCYNFDEEKRKMISEYETFFR